MDWTAFFNMGGYALYVWSAYGLAALILVANLVIALRRRKQVEEAVTRFIRQQAGKR